MTDIPTPPTLPPTPPPVVNPVATISPKPTKKLKPIFVIFFVVTILIIIGVALATGIMSRIVPGLNQVQLSYWGLWESEEIMRPILDEFEKSYPNIKVAYSMESPQEYRERLQTSLNQGKGPDIFRIHNTWTPMFKQYLAPVPSSVYSPADYEKLFYPVTRQDFRSSSGFLAVPLGIDGLAMYINDDLLQKNYLSVPKDWNELKSAALAMSECDTPDKSCERGGKIMVSGVALGATNVDHWQDILAIIMLQNNVDLSRMANSDAAANDVINYINSFTRDYRVWDVNLPPSTNSFAAGKVGIYFGPSWRAFDIKTLNPNLHFSIHPLPQLPVDPDRGEAPVTYASYWAEGVNNKSPNSQAAWTLIKYLSSPEVLTRLSTQAISPTRIYGQPYGRTDMANLVTSDSPAAVFISQAPQYRSWYLTSFTHDGPTGINTRMSDVFAKAFSGASGATLGEEVSLILSDYGLAPAPAQ